MGELSATDKLAVLGRAARLLASASDFEQTLANTIHACLPSLADFGFFDVVIDGTATDGTVVRTARAHEDERIEAVLRPTRWVRNERKDMNLCALSSGEPGLHTHIDDAWFQAIAANDGHLGLLRTLAFTSMLTVPMRYRGELVGALTLFYGRSGRQHTEDDRAFAEDLAALAVPVVVNARLLENHRRAERALRDSEERLRLAAKAGGLGLWDWNIVDDRVTWSDRVYEHFGVTKGGFGGTRADFARLVHPDDAAQVQGRLQRAIEHGESYAHEFRVLQPDGTIRWLGTRAEVLRDADDKPVRMLGTTFDVTSRVQLLADAERARAQAEQANRAKDEFLAILGHELRNPLAPIVTALDLMNHRDDISNRRERDIIARQVTHLSRLVDDLLDVSRIVRGKVELTAQPTDLRTVVDEALEAASPLFEQRGLALSHAIESCWVDGDPVRLSQIVTNLLTNAAKFTPSGGRVEVTLTGGDDHAVLTVRDTGLGIAPLLLPTIFGLFVQGPQPLDRRQGGLGLGLAIVANLVDLHGGTVHAESEGLGRGATFCVRLPRIAAPRAAASPAPQVAAPMLATTAPGNVLVVDDNVDAAELLADLLRMRGYQVTVEANAPAALHTASRICPDLAILDIGLPDMDGYELARRLRSSAGNSGLRLVALTGYGRETDREQARAAGFDHHLAKPVSPDVLFSTVEELLS